MTAMKTSRTATSTTTIRRTPPVPDRSPGFGAPARRRRSRTVPAAGPAARPPPGPGQGHRTDGGGGQHRDLAHGVDAPDVDEDHVHDVPAAAVGHRPLDHLAGHRLGGAVPRGGQRQQEHGDADGGGHRQPHRPAGRGGPALEAVGQAAQDQHEQHGRQRLDRHLGQRQVRRRPARRTAPPSRSRWRPAAARPRTGGGRPRRRAPSPAGRCTPPRGPPSPGSPATPASRRPATSAPVVRSAAVVRITPAYTGSEPLCTTAVTRSDSVFTPRSTPRYASPPLGTRWPSASTRATGRRARNSPRPPARTTSDSTSGRPRPCHSARCTGSTAVDSDSAAPPISSSAAAGTSPNSTVSAASTAAGATNHPDGRRGPGHGVPGPGEAERPPREPQAVGHGEHRRQDDRGQHQPRVGERPGLERREGVLLGDEAEHEREAGHRGRRHQRHDRGRPPTGAGPRDPPDVAGPAPGARRCPPPGTAPP